MKSHYQVLVIGGGPAGLATASAAARQGLDVALVDEQQAPGGQIYRNVAGSRNWAIYYLGKDYLRGKQLVVEFRQSGADYINNASVWYLDERLDSGRRDAAAQRIDRSLKRHLSIRPFVDKLYAPAPAFQLPDDETLVCRCEEVKAGQIRQAARMGCVGPNQVKAFTRCGMGPCQGCLCGSTVSALIADEIDSPLEAVGYFRVRPPFKPITLGELADS